MDTFDFPLMLPAKLPVVDKIHPQSNKFAACVENKATSSDSKLNNSLDLYTWVERGTVRVKCLAQEPNRMTLARAGSLNT